MRETRTRFLGGWSEVVGGGPAAPAPAPEKSRTCSAGADDHDVKTRPW